MKSIKLTKEHKSKLLEMCKKLFPKYKHIWFNECYESIVFEEGITKQNKSIDIHWFEFCMTHLQDKLKSFDKCFENNVDCDIELMSCWYESHPVDYLYEEFKKLKQ